MEGIFALISRLKLGLAGPAGYGGYRVNITFLYTIALNEFVFFSCYCFFRMKQVLIYWKVYPYRKDMPGATGISEQVSLCLARYTQGRRWAVMLKRRPYEY